MTEWMIRFWQENSSGVLVSLFTGLLFFVLGPIGVWFSGRRIRMERRRRASQALLDLLEDMLVSGEKIDPINLSALFRAMERETDVVLEGFYDAETLFEDLALRFARSRHLDSAQKNRYSDEIQRISKDLAASVQLVPEKPTERHIPRAYSKILEDLKQAISTADSSKASSLTTELEERLAGGGSNQDIFRLVISRYIRLFKERPISTTIGVLLALAVYAAIFIYFIQPSLNATQQR